MSELGTTWERESLGGGRYRHTQHMRPIAYRDAGVLKRINNDWQNDHEDRPHMVTAAPFLVSVGNDGLRRIHPTCELDRYIEMGAPFVKIGGVWQQVSLRQPTRTGNRLAWTTNNANMYVDMGGHFIKLAILLKNGWQPPEGKFAFPVGLTGLTRTGGQLYADGVPVMSIRAPHLEDYDNPEDVRPVAWDFVQVNGQWYVLFTLPSLAGMSRPLVDPTLTLQPDAAAGKDTWIREDSADSNYATDAFLYIASQASVRRYTLLKFDLSSIPASAIVTAGTLSLWPAANLTTRSYAINCILAANNGWTEAGATWNYALASSQRWAGDTGSDGGTDAGCSVSGTDFNGTPLGSFTASGEAANTEIAITLNVAQVQALLSANYGFIWRRTTVAAGFKSWRSSDHANAAYRPKLVVEYTVGVPGGMLRGLT